MADTENLEELRKRIDEIDRQIIMLLDARMEACRKIGEIKKKTGRPIIDTERTLAILERAGRYRDVYSKIIDKCVEEQENT